MEARRGYDSGHLRKGGINSYPSVVDRYYKKLYKTDVKGREGEDYCILLHSNRICLVTLAPSHPVVREKKTVTKVDFQINKRTNRLQNPLSGKRKRGAQQLVENAALCIIKCSDGSTYQPSACLKASLVEANENLVARPNLLATKPETEGYIAIVLTRLQDHKQEIQKLMTAEEYHKKLEERARKRHLVEEEKRNEENCGKDEEVDAIIGDQQMRDHQKSLISDQHSGADDRTTVDNQNGRDSVIKWKSDDSKRRLDICLESTAKNKDT